MTPPPASPNHAHWRKGDTSLEASTLFSALSADAAAPVGLRAAIAAAHRAPEPACVAALVEQASAAPEEAPQIGAIATALSQRLRGKTRSRSGGVEGLIHEYSLSSQEGVALMCLAEALLRIPDAETRDALIRDKLSPGDWRAHVGQSPSLFVNAATWGLALTGKLVATNSEQGLSAALTRLIARSGEPIIRAGVDVAMRLMGEQFVAGRNIEEALSAAVSREANGFAFSYDMLGEAATTAADAARYLAEYEHAIHAIGKASAGRGIYEGPGVSIKLSALHPRYQRSKRARVMAELLPRAKNLAALARSYQIGFNVDAEEADRLELSLDIFEALACDPELTRWNGLGFVIQAYGKRCPAVIDWLVDLGRRAKRRLMVRLVKGAYWDSEIKRAQLDGLPDFPVYTRKVHTDVAYLACARKLLAAPDAVYPQFATHNAQTLASVMAFAGPNYYRGQYEFQCLHGMGEPLYEEVVGREKLDRPCRVYAPVGSHETLLAYLVRRLLENGANTSFVNRIADTSVSLSDLIADPVQAARAIVPPGAPHPLISAPLALYGPERRNSLGLDLASEAELAALAAALARLPDAPAAKGQPVVNPSDHGDIVGRVTYADAAQMEAALARAEACAPAWAAVSPTERGAILRRAADAFEDARAALIALAVREAGKSYANAVGEVREAVDFLRYYAQGAARLLGPGGPAPLGPVVCISPWNFPLAIFTGQIAAALAAGNVVLAKPAEETPLIAAEAVRLLHGAGVPREALQWLPGAGEVGAALVADGRAQGVMFTGSTPVAGIIARTLAGRLTRAGQPIPLIAETGGLNAMIVDSSALAEQVVGDVIASAFDSAGQRCSALRILCLQEDGAGRTLAMLKGALAELEVGDPRKLSTDVGPVISAGGARPYSRPHRHHARARICGHASAAAARRDEGNFCRAHPHRDRPHRRRRKRDFRPGAACAALQARRSRPVDRRHQRFRLRPHLRSAHPHRRDDRAGGGPRRGRQYLRQPQHYRRDRRRAAVRRVGPFRHGAESRRPALSRPAVVGAAAACVRWSRRNAGIRIAGLCRLVARGRGRGRGGALRRLQRPIAARRTGGTRRPRRRAQCLCAAAARAYRGLRGDRDGPAPATGRDSRHRQRRGGSGPAGRRRIAGTAGGTGASRARRSTTRSSRRASPAR